jgi:integrase
VVEHYLDTVGVTGSNPVSRTIFLGEFDNSLAVRTDNAQNSEAFKSQRVRFPKKIRHRKIEAVIYGKKPKYPFYRLAYYEAGKRQLRSFKTYQEAKAEGERIVREIADGSPVSALNADQSRDALAAWQRLEILRQNSGRRFSLMAAVSSFAEATEKLKGRPLHEIVESYLRTMVSIQQKDLTVAVEEFIESRRHKSEMQNGKRAQMSKVYASNVAGILRGFAGMFPATMVSDLSKEHLDLYFKPLTHVSTKNRNDRRATIKMFLSWAVKKDYLASHHRLLEADGMAREIVEKSETDFYRPKELQTLLAKADKDLLPVIALGGLGGLRVEEIMRLEWADVWRGEGQHIEISAKNAKTRQRRLVEMCSALVEWLKPYQKKTGKVFGAGINVFHWRLAKWREQWKIPARRNGLRHAFCTYHFALHSNENLTAAQAGNSPAMIHAHYKGLATKADAEKWFQVTPKWIPNV